MTLDNAEDQFALHRVSKDGNLSLVKDLLGGDEVKPKILKKDSDGDTVLHVASTVNVLRFLLEKLGDTAKAGICQPDRRGRTVLHTTVLRKDVDMLMVLVDLLEDQLEDVIFRMDSQKMTVLHHAAEIGNLKAIEIFLSKLGNQAKDEILRTDKSGKTVLHRAAAGGDIKAFMEIMSSLSDDYEMSETDINGDTILHTAARKGSVSIVEILLDRLGDEGSKDAIQQKNKDNRNILHVAAYEGKKDALVVLLGKLGNEAKRVICEKDVLGGTVLHAAVNSDRFDIIKVVLTALGSQAPNIINEKDTSGKTVLRLAVDHGNVDIVHLIVWKLGEHAPDGIFEEDSIGRTVLHEAIERGNVGIFKTLMDKLGDRAKEGILKKDKQNQTLLHAVVNGGNNDIFKMLMLEFGVQVKNTILQADADGNNPLHLAVWLGRSNMIKEIAELGGRDVLRQRNNKNATPIHVAAEREDIVKSLFQLMNIKVQEMKDILDEGRTLHVACELGNKYMLETLLNPNTEGAVKDIMARDELFLGNTALHAAAIGGDLDIFKQLLDVAGSSCNDINKVKNWYGQTPLHFAVAQDNYELVQYLIEEKGANPAQEDNAGVTPFHFAARSASERVLRFISDSLGKDYNINQVTGLAGLSSLHYAAWNGNEEAIDWLLGAEKNNKDEIDLEVKDEVEKQAPWYWSVLGSCRGNYNKERSHQVLKTLVTAHISEGKNPFTDDIQGFLDDIQDILESLGDIQESLEDRLNLDGELLDVACCETLEGVSDGKLSLSQSLISCVAAYGNATTTSKLADKLRKVDDKTFVQGLLLQSRPLKFAAMCANADESRVGVAKKFLAAMKETEEFHEQLESSLKTVLRSMDKKGFEFAKLLVKHMRPSPVHELLRAELSFRMENDNPNLKKIMEDKLKNLRWLDQFEFEDFNDFVKDVPLAYWMAHLHQTEQKALHTSTSTERDEVDKSTSNIVIFIKELIMASYQVLLEDYPNQVVLQDYPNNVGNRTGRTALHWAVIFGDMEIAKELCGDIWCKRNVVDRFGKSPYSYTTLHSTKYYEGCLEWHMYEQSLQRDREMYIDALNAILIGAALIATVTFSGVLQPPLQYPMSNRDPNPDIKYVAIDRGDVQTFWVLNSLSFFFSMASALAGVAGVLPNDAVFNLALVERIRRLLVQAAFFLVLSITFVLAAFASAGFAVLPQVLKLRANMIATTLIGGSCCVCMLCKFAKAVDEAVHTLIPDSSWNLIPKLIRRWLWISKRRSSIWSSRRRRNTKMSKPCCAAPPRKDKSIRSRILKSCGYVPWEYVWDDGLWDEPFAKKDEPSGKKDEPSGKKESRIDIQVRVER